VRDGITNKETYTLEVCLGATCFVQKVSLRDIQSCKNYAKQLAKKGSGYTMLYAKKQCDYHNKTSVTLVLLRNTITDEEREQKRNKKRKEERKREKFREVENI